MNKITTTIAIITGLFGLAITTRSDVLYSLPIGSVLLVFCGLLFYFSQKTLNENDISKFNVLLEAISLEEIKSSLLTLTETLKEVAETINSNNKQIIDMFSAKHDVALKTNYLLEYFTTTFQSELIAFVEQQVKSYNAKLDAIIITIGNFKESSILTENDLVKRTKIIIETIDKIDESINKQINSLHSISSQTEESLTQALSILQNATETFIEQQQSLSEIIIDDVKETLAEFTNNQSRNADDVNDSIKRIMNETNRALQDLPLSLERFSTQSFETMQKSAEGFLHFETLINATLKQLTDISDQDYELLRGMMK